MTFPSFALFSTHFAAPLRRNGSASPTHPPGRAPRPKRAPTPLLHEILPGHGLESGGLSHLLPSTITKYQRANTRHRSRGM